MTAIQCFDGDGVRPETYVRICSFATSISLTCKTGIKDYKQVVIGGRAKVSFDNYHSLEGYNLTYFNSLLEDLRNNLGNPVTIAIWGNGKVNDFPCIIEKIDETKDGKICFDWRPLDE